MKKTFTLICEIQENNTPTNWEFSKDVSGIERLAMLVIVKNIIEEEINKIIGK